MKKCLLILLTILITFSVVACNDTSQTIENDNNIVSETPQNDKSNKKDKGTRSNPYQFGEDVPISAMHDMRDGTGDEVKVDYVFNFNEIWGFDKVKSEYPNYDVDNHKAVRGNFSVSCEETDNPIYCEVYFKMITSNFEEVNIGAQSYIPKELNNSIDSVYNGGNYDSIFLIDEEYKDYDFPYMTITYTNSSNVQEVIWIAVPK